MVFRPLPAPETAFWDARLWVLRAGAPIEMTLRTIPRFLLPPLLHLCLLSFASIVYFPQYYLWHIE